MPGAVKWGSEFLLNVATLNHQNHPAITALADGRFVAAWESDGFAHVQVFNASTSKVGAELNPNSWGGSDPAVTALADGGFVTSFGSPDHTHSDYDGGVCGQAYHGDGSPSGGGQINGTLSGTQFNPAMATLSDGRYVAAWQHASMNNSDIRAQVFFPNGSTSGIELPVNTTTAGNQLDPAITALGNSRFVIAWSDMGSGNGDIRAQIFDGNGGTVGGEFFVASGAAGQDHAAITTLSTGNFLATWDEMNSDGFDDGLQGQIFDANGGKVGSQFPVNTTTDWDQNDSAVAALADGRFVVAWVNDNHIVDGKDIRAQVFDADGGKSGAEFLVNTVVAYDQIDPTITVLADGRFVVGWSDGSNYLYSTGYDVRGQVFDARETGVNLTGTSLNNDWVGSDFDDTMHGGTGDDKLKGGGGHDILDGGDGIDIMVGGASDDWYYVDNVLDVVIEWSGEGTMDRVLTNSDYTLPASADIEIISTSDNAGLGAINLAGNALGNIIFGNAGANTLDGAGGADTLLGLGGDDWYFVDDAGDVVFEGAGDGAMDRVFASVSYTLNAGAQVEKMSTTDNAGVGALNLTGNEVANIIYGNAGANTLNGGVGADTLVGLGGNDWYFVDNAGDAVIEANGGGADQVFTSADYTLGAGVHVETLSTTWSGGIANINLSGNAFDNAILGNAGSNALKGGLGNDLLFGGGGIDAFVFNTALNAATNVDTILDFSVADDDMVLASGIFTGLAPGMLSAAAFVTGSAAADASDRIIYDNIGGGLYYDADGVGGAAQIHFATVAAGLAITNADLLVV